MKKILLINTNMEKAPYPVPPLGLCMLAVALKGRFEVQIYDGVFDEGKGMPALVHQFNPDFIGFSIRNIDDVVMDRQMVYIDGILEKFIRTVKAITNVPVILGGSGFSIFPAELMKLTGADYGIVGEAETILPELLDRIQNKADTSDIPNLIISKKLEIQRGNGFRHIKPVPDRFSDIDRWIDFTPYMNKGVYSIQTKRGCAHGCIYCTYPLIEGRKFRTRKASDIADEIELAHQRLGNITFEFVDSTFNDPKGHAEEICREIISRKLKVRLRTMGINPRHTSEELFELMVEAGFVQIDATPDSASPRILKSLDKGFELEEIEKMATLIRKFNLPTMWFFLFGGPGEVDDTFRETLDFIDAYINKEDLVYMNAGLRIYPGTPLYSIALAEGRIPAGQSVFHPPVYYYAHGVSKNRLDGMIKAASLTRHNCIPAMETAPSSAMIAEAVESRRLNQLDEPMFRTLLRIRAAWRIVGRI
ncbi:MAG: radical SAM protein [Bacteroidales bacterium]|nr:radical SAM protein [Bacteroidales bacterium]